LVAENEPRDRLAKENSQDQPKENRMKGQICIMETPGDQEDGNDTS
jgi:hypothetical protein